MADVKVNIPGIGEVVATNAASEETLNKILAVMSKTTKAKDPAEGIFKTMVKDYRDQKKAADDFEKSLEGLTEEQKKAAKIAQVNWENSRKLANALEGGRQAVSAVAGTLGSLGKSVISLGAQMATSYDDMAKNPIRAAAGQVDTAIDMAKTAVHGVADTAAGVAHAFGGFPVIGPIVSGLGDAFSAATKAIADFGAEMLHVANDIMSKEFQKSADALDSYTKQGASFANGMMEMRETAHEAGISISILSEIGKKSSDNIRAMGVTQGEGVAILSKGMGSAAKTIGKSGATLRDEMLSMGYSYEEQGELMASYGAQLKASGVDLKNLAPAELAAGTKEYARNVKILSDLTGQDAQKAMEKARIESTRGALMNTLNKDQRDAFIQSSAIMGKLGPDFQEALMQRIANIPITNPAIGASKELMEMIEKIAQQTKAGNKEIANETSNAILDAQNKMKAAGNSGLASITDSVNLAMRGQAGVASDIAKQSNAVLAFQVERNQAKKSSDALDAQTALAGKDSLEKSYASITKTMQDNAIAMEITASAHLKEYGAVLKKTADETAAAFKTALDWINNNFKPKTEYSDTAENSAKIQEEGLKVLSNPKSSFWEKLGASTAMGAGLSNGGIASGPTSGFLQKLHGSELVVPLQADGTPKTGTDGYKMLMDIMSSPGNVVGGTQSSGATGGTNDFASSLKDIINPIASLTDIVKKLTDGLSKGSNAGASTNTATDMAQQIADDWQSKQYNIMQEMVGHLRDHKDISQKLLYAGM
jgi:hypothetical protein